MRLRTTITSLIGIAAAGFVAACNNDSTSVSHAPTHIIVLSGANQSGNLSAPLDSALVVQVLDGLNKAVANVPLRWSVVGGGTLSADSTTTDNNGKSTVTWTLAPTAGTQVVTVTSSQITGGSVSFVASNGATVTGVVSAAATNPFNATFARRAARTMSLSTSAGHQAKRLSPDRVVVGFKSGSFGLAAASSMAYRNISVARSAATQLRTRVAALVKAQPVDKIEISPAIMAARVRVLDTTKVDAVIAALQADPNVAWVQRDGIISIRDGAPRPMSTSFIPALSGAPSNGSPNAATKTPNDPGYFEQAWSANMIDLPRAWGITTGSPAVTVAVVDMGIRFDHKNIAANLTNDGYDFVSQLGFGDTEPICATRQLPASSFTTIDGDGDGPDPDPTDPDDLEFDDANGCWQHSTLGDHGLWTAGIIGAVGNQGLGTAGVNWNVKIRPIRVLGITGDGSDFDIAQGVLYAAGLPATGANGALVQAPRSPIINMSLGGSFDDSTLRSAVDAATAAGSLIVASAGNDGLDLPAYPAAYDNVVAVSAVGMDGQLATYSNAGRFVSVAAPGGDFRLDDNGGGGVLGPGWDFSTANGGQATYLFGYGTSAAAPFVSGVAALLLAQTPGLTAAQLSSRIEQFATRAAGASRSDSFGWGIVDAYNALVQQNGPTRATYVRLVDATSGVVARSTTVGSDGSYAFTKVPTGTYYVQAGDDESGDSTIGVPGRRFATAGGIGKPTVVNVNGNSNAVAILLGLPTEVEPNDDVAHANLLTVGSYVIGSITPPDVADFYSVNIPTAGVYTFETSGLVGSCGLGIELDTQLSVASAAGQVVGSNDNISTSGNFCSRVSATLQPGIYYVTVTGTPSNGLTPYGRYRLQVRSGP